MKTKLFTGLVALAAFVFADEPVTIDGPVTSDGIQQLIPGVETDQIEFEKLGISDLTGVMKAIREQAAAAGVDPRHLEALLTQLKPSPRHHLPFPVVPGPVPADPSFGPGPGPLFPRAEIHREVIELDYCHRVAPYNPKWILRLPKGPGHFDLIVYPVVYNREESYELILVHSLKGIVFDKILTKSTPHVRWLVISERFGNEYEISKAAKGYIEWLKAKECPPKIPG